MSRYKELGDILLDNGANLIRDLDVDDNDDVRPESSKYSLSRDVEYYITFILTRVYLNTFNITLKICMKYFVNEKHLVHVSKRLYYST